VEAGGGMKQIIYQDVLYYKFAESFSRSYKTEAKIFPTELRLELANHTVCRLLERLGQASVIILPYFASSQSDIWIITGTNRRELDRTLSRLSYFIIPTYAEYADNNHAPKLKEFRPEDNELQQLGALLYPTGYYSWRSPVAHRQQILQRLKLWLDLEDSRPSLHIDQKPSYFELQRRFNSALAATSWQDAAQVLDAIQRLNTTTADNLAFLEIQLLAQQQRWSEIWQRADFEDVALLRVPRSVRAALLTAFHQVELLALEQTGNWEALLAKFGENQSRLGSLLVSRYGISQSSVVRVFGYQVFREENSAGLAELTKLPNDSETQVILLELGKLLGLPTAPTVSTLAEARTALNECNFDRAIELAEHLPASPDKAFLLVQIAHQLGDSVRAENAWLEFNSLEEAEQAVLHSKYPQLKANLAYLETLTQNVINQGQVAVIAAPQTQNIQDWLDWFAHFKTSPHDPALFVSLEMLNQTTDERYWTAEKIVTVNQLLFDFIGDANSNATVKTATRYLTEFFLKDLLFPHPEPYFNDLYDTLYLLLLETPDKNTLNGRMILRLAEAKLRQNPAKAIEVFDELKRWNERLLPVFEEWVLEVFELLAEYGLEPTLLTGWYRQWADYILNLPTRRERLNLQVWLSFGQWTQVGADILTRLQASLADQEDAAEDPLANLPAGYRIGIFTFRQAAAERVKGLLLARKSDLDIRVCLEKDLNEPAKAIAQNSDMVVIVTTCISHALTYGIRPFLTSEPVFPQSDGSTSIVRAIEERIRQKLN
jgi:hypothetical protein